MEEKGTIVLLCMDLGDFRKKEDLCTIEWLVLARSRIGGPVLAFTEKQNAWSLTQLKSVWKMAFKNVRARPYNGLLFFGKWAEVARNRTSEGFSSQDWGAGRFLGDLVGRMPVKSAPFARLYLDLTLL